MSTEVTVRPAEQIRTALERMQTQFQMVLPPEIKPEKFVRVVMTAVQAQPDLMMADRTTLYAEAMKCATDGLVPDGREAALLVFNGKGGKVAKYLPMVAGVIKRARNSGQLVDIGSQVIYQKELDEGRFDHWIDEEGEHLKHRPITFGDRGEMVGVYAWAKDANGTRYIEVMNRDQVMAIKGSSRSGDRGPWSGPFEPEMWRKSAIKRLSKRLPLSSQLDEALRRDDDLYGFDQRPESERQPHQSRLKSIVNATTTPEPVADAEYEPIDQPPVDDVPDVPLQEPGESPI